MMRVRRAGAFDGGPPLDFAMRTRSRAAESSGWRSKLISMSSYVVGSLIGAGAVLLGSALAGFREGRARNAERSAARTAELTTAMREYLAALDSVATELLDEPSSSELTWLDRQFARLIERAGLVS